MLPEPNAPPRPSHDHLALDRTQTLVPRSDATATASARATVEPLDDGEGGDDRYQLLGEHGRGGLGRVVRAHDRHLGRTVAVKELLRKSDLGEKMFVREAMITARLEHPGIIPVHEAGRWPNGDPYYVMKLVSGRTLKEVMDAADSLGSRLALLPHLIAVAEAVGYAHSEGVIHRDLKPANVLVGEYGETVVIDWGLARDLRGDDDVLVDAVAGSPSPSPVLTVSGRVIGTPQYMAPEQARGETVGTTADVYALGAMLYELLSGRPAVEGETVQNLLDQVHAGPPRALALAAPGVPADLEAIVGKAMARTPSERYPSARELAADLKRFQTGQLVTAQRYGRWRLLRRWVGRNRGYVGMGAMALIAVAVIAASMLRSVLDERALAQDQRRRAEVGRTAAVEGEHQLVLAQARGSLGTDPTEALAWIKRYPIGSGNAARIRTLIDEAEAGGVATQIWKIGEAARGVALSSDGTRVVVGGRDGSVSVRDTATGAVKRFGDGAAPIAAIAMPPTRHELYVGDARGRLASLDGDTGVRTELGQLDDGVVGLFPVGDGGLVVRTTRDVWRRGPHGEAMVKLFEGVALPERMAVGWDQRTARLRIAHGADGKVRLWRGRAAPITVAVVEGMPQRIAITDDGRLAIVATTAALHLIELDRGRVHLLAELRAETNAITIDPTQRRAAVTTKGAEVYLVELARGDVQIKRGHTDGVYTAAFDGRGERMVTASDDGTVRVWDLPTGDVRELRGHTDDVVTAAISDDGRTILSTSVDDTMRIWKVDDRRTTVVGLLDEVHQLVSLGGDRVRVLSYGQGVQIVDVDLRERRATVRLADPEAVPSRSVMTPTGAALIVHAPTQAVLWHDGASRSLSLSRDTYRYSVARTGRVVGVELDGTVWRNDERGTATIAHAEPSAKVVAALDGATAVVEGSTQFRVIDVETGADRVTVSRAELGVSETTTGASRPRATTAPCASGTWRRRRAGCCRATSARSGASPGSATTAWSPAAPTAPSGCGRCRSGPPPTPTSSGAAPTPSPRSRSTASSTRCPRRSDAAPRRGSRRERAAELEASAGWNEGGRDDQVEVVIGVAALGSVGLEAVAVAAVGAGVAARDLGAGAEDGVDGDDLAAVDIGDLAQETGATSQDAGGGATDPRDLGRGGLIAPRREDPAGRKVALEGGEAEGGRDLKRGALAERVEVRPRQIVGIADDRDRAIAAMDPREEDARRIALGRAHLGDERVDVGEVAAGRGHTVGLGAEPARVLGAGHAELEAPKRRARPERRVEVSGGVAEEPGVDHGAVILVGEDDDQEVGVVADEAGVGGQGRIDGAGDRGKRLLEATALLAETCHAPKGLGEISGVVAGASAGPIVLVDQEVAGDAGAAVGRELAAGDGV